MTPRRVLAGISLILALALVAGSARAGFNAFLKLEGVPGESAAPGRGGWIDVESYSWVTPPPAPPPAPAPAGVARRSQGSISFVKKIDKASPLLSKAVATGKPLGTVTFEVSKPSQGSQPYMRYELKNAMVSSYSISGGGAMPSEHVTFSYSSIELRYEEQKVPPKPGADVSRISSPASAVAGTSAVTNPSPSAGGEKTDSKPRRK